MKRHQPVEERAVAKAGASPLHAWIDESMRIGGKGPGTYILAAVVCAQENCGPIREVFEALRLKGQERLHWHDESDRRRAELATAVSTLALNSIVVVGMPVVSSKQERARRVCMESLLRELDALGVSQVWLEARSSRLNEQDQKHIRAMRGGRMIGAGIRVDSARPLEEPMLWAPDIVAGSVNASKGGQPQFLEIIEHLVTEVEIAIR